MKKKLLNKSYNYYDSIKYKSDKLAEKVYNKKDEIFKFKLYNLILNLCNQFVYDYTYIFSKDDLYFIADNNINLFELLNEFYEDIVKGKSREVKINIKHIYVKNA